MKILLYSLFLFANTLTASAQLVQMKDQVAYVNDVPYAKVVKMGCKSLQAPCSYQVTTMSGVRVCMASVRMQTQTDAEKKVRKPPVYYVAYNFYEPENLYCETPFPIGVSLYASDVATELARAGIIYEGDIDEEALYDFIDTYGTTFSSKSSLEPKEISKEKVKSKKDKEEDEEEDED